MAMEIFTVGRGQEGYPERLMPFADMPSRLFVRGALPADEQKTAAIVGARMCTAYGKSQAAFFAQVLAANGVAVISGLACGIDAAAHEGALRGKGKTFAVLGCGVDICYPKQNYPLMRRMLENGGGVLSEFPPGAEPLPWHFPIRNRVISALADVVLVIEAKEKSGSLITADYALEQGKTVFALPGRTTDATSRGCNRLIAQGAEIAISPETILEELGVKKAGTKRAAPRPRYGKEAEMVLKTLAAEPQNLAQLAGSTGIPLQELTGILLALDLHRDAAENNGGQQLPTAITVDGQRCARLMTVLGAGRSGLENRRWQDNLSLALKLQVQLEQAAPGITRPISLRPQRFNQDLVPFSLLVEVGSAGDTLEEALRAADLLAACIISLQNGSQ